jgi:hypothetical protein
MATGISPSGIDLPSPSLRGEKVPVPVLARARGGNFSRPHPRAGINPRGDPRSLLYSSVQSKIAKFFSQLHSNGFGFKQELLNFLNRNKFVMRHTDTKQRGQRSFSFVALKTQKQHQEDK